MSRQGEGIGFDLPKEVHDEFKKKVKESGRNKTWVLQRLVEFYLRPDAEEIILGLKKVNHENK